MKNKAYATAATKIAGIVIELKKAGIDIKKEAYDYFDVYLRGVDCFKLNNGAFEIRDCDIDLQGRVNFVEMLIHKYIDIV